MKISLIYIFLALITYLPININPNIFGKVTYKVSFEIIKDTTTIENFASDLFSITVDKLKNLEFELCFNKTESLYAPKENLFVDPDDNFASRSAKKLAGDSRVYTNLRTNKKITKKNFLGDDFIINDHNNFDWVITNETKKIMNLICYKAYFRVQNDLNPNGKKVTAWFTPEIPISTGPKGYSGLPGLILELKENRLTYYCSNIIMSEFSNCEIMTLKGGIEISNEEYENYVLKKIREYQFEKN